jgi:diadenosine tetraphosphatase ApaH/serine/threonine PP2A family protein phosphatase
MCSDDGSVVIVGLGLRLAQQTTESLRVSRHPEKIDNCRVFVTELIEGGAAQRSNLLRQNDEIMHVDNVPTHSRTVMDVKNAILGTPGTSVRIGIRRGSDLFELSFVRGHTQEHSTGIVGSRKQLAPSKDSEVKSCASVKAKPTSCPTPKALFRSSPMSKGEMGLSCCLTEAARRGDMETVARLAESLLSAATSGQEQTVRSIVFDAASDAKLPTSGNNDLNADLKFQPHSASISHSSGTTVCTLVPTMQHDGLTPMPAARMTKQREAAASLLAIIEPLMDATANGETPPPTERESLRLLTLEVAAAASEIQLQEPRLLEIPAPCHVLGDIHGNLSDLTFFRRTIWPAGPAGQGADILFLGDFVDRGADSLPVVAYMMALKVLYPNKWWMIRGNHETREVNGNIRTYRDGSFLNQCLRIFGDTDGRAVWDSVNDFFDTLPLAARIGGRIFCVHGGIPRELCQPHARLEDINAIEVPLRLVRRGDMVHAMLWSDPVPLEREVIPETERELDSHGFGLSSRGCACFGEKAIETFMLQHDISYIFRGHEAQQRGIGLSRSGRLCTVFSTSQDHFSPDVKTTCGCVLISREGILPIVRGEPTARQSHLWTRPPASATPVHADFVPFRNINADVPPKAVLASSKEVGVL